LKKIIIQVSLFLYIISFTNTIYSQEIILPEKINNILGDQNTIHMFSNNLRYEFDVIENKISKPIKIINGRFDLFSYRVLAVKGVIYFVHRSGGMVLKLVDNKVVRIDKSFNHKMQFSSSIFTYNDNIYRYGGYGFFSTRDFIVVYDFDSNEWESVPSNSDLVPIGRFDNGFFINNDMLYIIGGTTVGKQNTDERFELDDFWSFSFKNNEWKNIANDEIFKFFKLNAFNFQNNIITTKNNSLHLLNIDSNEIRTYKLNSTFIKRNDGFPVIYINNNLYFVITRNNRERVMIHRDIDEVFSTLTDKKTLNKSPVNLILTSLLSVVIFIVIIIKIINYLKTIYVFKNEIKFRNIKLSIAKEEFEIFKQFYTNNYILENNILMDIIYKKQYDRTHNIRLKNNLIVNLNSKLQLLIKNNTGSFIKSKQSKYDKRFKSYYLNLTNFKLIFKD
jgi:hypothetical protein